MKAPDWRTIPLEQGVLREPSLEGSRIVLWLPGASDGTQRHWERISNVSGAEISLSRGVCATPATSIQATQKLQGVFGKLLGRFRKGPDAPSWILPTGESVLQAGERQTDLLLTWATDGEPALDDARLRELWPAHRQLRRLGPNLFLVAGAQPEKRIEEAPVSAPAQSDPRQLAEDMLAAARRTGDQHKEVLALTDLGLAYLRNSEVPRAVAHLEQAMNLAEHLGEAAETDVRSNLSLALMAMNQASRSVELLNRQLAHVRQAGDRYQEKLALAYLGLAHSDRDERPLAIEVFQQALTLARELNDRQHEADLLWFMAVEYAELEQRSQALEHGQQALALLEKMGHAQVAVIRQHVEEYARRSAPEGAAVEPESPWIASPTANGPKETIDPSLSPPNILRMAVALAKSPAKFFEAGHRTLPPAAYRKRLQTCASCPHFTGARCKLSASFTPVKAWIPHETCPMAKWPE